jgi:hypothetical protein
MPVVATTTNLPEWDGALAVEESVESQPGKAIKQSRFPQKRTGEMKAMIRLVNFLIDS